MDKKILDVTCGSRSIWFDKHHLLEAPPFEQLCFQAEWRPRHESTLRTHNDSAISVDSDCNGGEVSG